MLTLLEDEEWSKWSDSDIAKRCGVDHKTVSRHRASLGNFPSEKPTCEPSKRTYKTKHGTVAKMDTANIGRTKQRQNPRKPGGISPDAFKPVRQPRPALAQTNLNLPHDPAYGARAIVSAMGADYARNLIDSLAACLENLSSPAEVDE